MTLKLEKKEDAWWIVDPTGELEDHGPYFIRKEADEDRRGLERWLRSNKRWRRQDLQQERLRL